MVRALLLWLCLLMAPARAQVGAEGVAPVVALPADQARLELILDDPDATPFEGQMVLATLRGTYRVRIANEELKLRRMNDVDWLRLGQDVWRDERIDGRMARVMERRIALFPRRAGDLTILPVAHELEYLAPDHSRTRAIVRSPALTLPVRPRPEGAGKDWLPVRALELSDSWSSDAGRLVDGETVQRRVILRALGATPDMLPPQPPMREPWLITFAPPEERSIQLTPEGPVTTVVWVWTLRPTRGEPGVLPEVVIPWYDTSAATARVVRIPAAPIGYESFADNSADTWQSGFADPGLLGGIWALAALVTLIIALRGRGGMGRRIRDLRLAWIQIRQRHALRRAASRGDGRAFRRIAAGLLTPQNAPRVLAPLDRALYGSAPEPTVAQLRQLRHAVLRALT